jgi:hypothetical protein
MICANCLKPTQTTEIREDFHYEYWGSKECKTSTYEVTRCCEADEVYDVDEDHYDLFVRYMRRFGTYPTQISKPITL